SAVRVHDLFDDGEAEPEAPVPSRGRSVGLPKGLEYALQELAGDPLSRIAYDNVDLGPIAARLELDLAPLWGEFHGVREEIPDDLLNAIGIGGNDSQIVVDVHVEPDLFRLRGGADDFNRSKKSVRNVGRDDLEPQLSTDDSRKIEHIVDDPGLRSCVSFDD